MSERTSIGAPLVLVTGGSGYVASHVIRKLLHRGFRVRTTVRSIERARELKQRYECFATDRLTVLLANLDSDEGWAEATDGCTFVQHVASPFPLRDPKNPDDLIGTARDGTLRVLRAASDAGVKRVVLTSSFAAVGYSEKSTADPYTEVDWTDPKDKNSAYVRSKTIAEKAAWEFVERDDHHLELAVVNPVAIFGPVTVDDTSSSISIMKRLLDGSMPAAPDVSFGIVDVRDVAELHLRAMLCPEANGERFIATASSSISLLEIAQFLRSEIGPEAQRAPRRHMPHALARFMAMFRADLRPTLHQLGTRRAISSEKARSVLGWSPRPVRDTIMATALGVLDLNLLEHYASHN